MKLPFKSRTRFQALRPEGMTDSHPLPSRWGRAHWSHWWPWAERVPDALWCSSTLQRWLCPPGTCRCYDHANPPLLPAPGTDTPQTGVAPKPPKPPAVPAPLPSPPLKYDRSSQEAPRGSWGVFLLFFFFFGGFAEGQRKGWCCGFGMTAAFHRRCCAHPMSVAQGHRRVPTGAALTISTSHPSAPNPPAPFSVGSLEKQRGKIRGGGMEKSTRKPQRGAAAPRRDARPGDRAGRFGSSWRWRW